MIGHEMSHRATSQVEQRTSVLGAALCSIVLAALCAVSPVASAFAETRPAGVYSEPDSGAVTARSSRRPLVASLWSESGDTSAWSVTLP
jgi:hypothetical protein